MWSSIVSGLPIDNPQGEEGINGGGGNMIEGNDDGDGGGEDEDGGSGQMTGHVEHSLIQSSPVVSSDDAKPDIIIIIHKPTENHVQIKHLSHAFRLIELGLVGWVEISHEAL
ncbi:hypothetical protein ACFE04_018381 [Oxalis oulophora]